MLWFFLKDSSNGLLRISTKRYFTKQTLINAICFLTNKCFFTIGNFVFKQDSGMQNSNWFRNILSQSYICLNLSILKRVISLGSSRAYKYHRVSTFIDGLCAINDVNEILTSF